MQVNKLELAKGEIPANGADAGAKNEAGTDDGVDVAKYVFLYESVFSSSR